MPLQDCVKLVRFQNSGFNKLQDANEVFGVGRF